ncbi:riboflavin synthase [Nocardioides sp. ChNu-153]|uniref:riboflavin synthase n=1 Tax=unclassified Nocardioides TaxID=2615069 RepID=UPI0024052A01|nr:MULTISPECIES: riboflavin synthase [unclassified Nocardioides]MDF9717210.1 riboflavin synthase [Nocardioides sp. ChNu-99]MDN7122993.1 riboflavin synthase [Nocardioides sp. ChNu-153]
MFTGIVEELGAIEAVEQQDDAIRLTVRAATVLGDTRLGDSIAVDGCCLTVASREDGTWTADVMAESLARTTLGRRRVGDVVNLERAVRADQRLGGHVVQGHVDAVGEVVDRRASEHWTVVEVAYPESLARFLVEKGSITVDGVSLTLVDVGARTFTVSLIPETLARTTLGTRAVGEPVNLEVDVIAKHVERLVSGGYADEQLARIAGASRAADARTAATDGGEA